MPELNITSASIGDFKGTITDFSVTPRNTDGVTGSKETWYTNPNWAKQLGYYTSIPELAAAIDAKATWTIGKGFKSNELTWLALSVIKGNAKDTFNTILENAV